jgi:Family of unknown function (DUF5681)
MSRKTSKTLTDKQRKNSEGKGDGQARKLANLKPFKPGESGNPKGRPKSLTLSEALRAQLGQVMPGEDEKTYAEKIALCLCEEAAKGNVGAAKEIADRTEGKPRQSLDVDMSLFDWRELARTHGITEQDVITEAQRIIKESLTVTSH